MRFDVVWTPIAEEELAEIWLAAPDRQLVTEVATDIDRRLALNPENEGESREGIKRVILVAPLTVFYEVLPDEHLVQVLHVVFFTQH